MTESRPNVGPFVFFDLGNTLVDLRPLVADLATVLHEEFRLSGTECALLAGEWIHRSWERLPRGARESFRLEIDVASETLSWILLARGFDADVARCYAMLRRSWEIFEGHVALCQGISHEWLASVRKLSSGLGIITDGDDENVSRLIRRLNLGRVFGCIVTSESVRTYKPNRLIYDAALKRLGADAARSLFVSDTALDLEGAVGAGLAAALLFREPTGAPPGLPQDALVLRTPRKLNRVLEGFSASGAFRSPG